MSPLLPLSILCLLGSALGAVEVIQDGVYVLEYNMVNNDTFSVTASVRSLGWVGVGLSRSGDMSGADLIIGGVNNTTGVYIGDYFGITNSRPVEDVVNNILTSSVSENATHTTISFTRLADTGDDVEDLALSRANYIVWAYSDSDSLSYHGNVNRGNISLSTLGYH